MIATQLVHIGKEANKWEEQHFLGEDEDAEIEYGVDPNEHDPDTRLHELCIKAGEREASRALGISRTALRRALTFRRKNEFAEGSRSHWSLKRFGPYGAVATYFVWRLCFQCTNIKLQCTQCVIRE